MRDIPQQSETRAARQVDAAYHARPTSGPALYKGTRQASLESSQAVRRLPLNKGNSMIRPLARDKVSGQNGIWKFSLCIHLRCAGRPFEQPAGPAFMNDMDRPSLPRAKASTFTARSAHNPLQSLGLLF